MAVSATNKSPAQSIDKPILHPVFWPQLSKIDERRLHPTGVEGWSLAKICPRSRSIERPTLADSFLAHAFGPKNATLVKTWRVLVVFQAFAPETTPDVFWLDKCNSQTNPSGTDALDIALKDWKLEDDESLRRILDATLVGQDVLFRLPKEAESVPVHAACSSSAKRSFEEPHDVTTSGRPRVGMHPPATRTNLPQAKARSEMTPASQSNDNQSMEPLIVEDETQEERPAREQPPMPAATQLARTVAVANSGTSLLKRGRSLPGSCN